MAVKWFGDRVNQRLDTKLRTNLEMSARELAQRVRDKIQIQGPPRSQPGEAPHIDHGNLIASYDHVTAPVGLSAAVGSTEPYAIDLEEGTPNMAPRPHLVPTLVESGDDLARIAAKP